MGYDTLPPVEGHEDLPSNGKAAMYMGGMIGMLYTGMNMGFDGQSLGAAAVLALPYALVGASLTPKLMNGIRMDYHVRRRAALLVAGVAIVGGTASNIMRDTMGWTSQDHDEYPERAKIIRAEKENKELFSPAFVPVGEELVPADNYVVPLPKAVWCGGREPLAL